MYDVEVGDACHPLNIENQALKKLALIRNLDLIGEDIAPKQQLRSDLVAFLTNHTPQLRNLFL